MSQSVFTKEEIVQAGTLIKNAKNIAIIMAKNLDGDSLGASCALHMVFQHLGKKCSIICYEDIPDNMKFIPCSHEIQKELHDISQYDLFIIADNGDAKLTGMQEKFPEIFDGTKQLINIDHHVSNKYYGTVNIVKPSIGTATIVIYKLFRFWNVRITPDIATALMLGIYTDTGSFMHSNTTNDVYDVAGKLVLLGANVQKISKHIFRTIPISTLHLWGRVLSRIRQNDRKITVSYVTDTDFEQTGAKKDELTGVVDFINAVPDSYFSLLITSLQGKIKGSLRTLRDDINLSTIAEIFGGGGHPKAAGFTIAGKLVAEERLKVQAPSFV